MQAAPSASKFRHQSAAAPASGQHYNMQQPLGQSSTLHHRPPLLVSSRSSFLLVRPYATVHVDSLSPFPSSAPSFASSFARAQPC